MSSSEDTSPAVVELPVIPTPSVSSPRLSTAAKSAANHIRASVVASTLLSDKHHHEHDKIDLKEADTNAHFKLAEEICDDVMKILQTAAELQSNSAAGVDIKFLTPKQKLERAKNVNNGQNSLPYIDSYCLFLAVFISKYPLSVLESLLSIGVDIEATIPKLPQTGNYSAESLGLVELNKSKKGILSKGPTKLRESVAKLGGGANHAVPPSPSVDTRTSLDAEDSKSQATPSVAAEGGDNMTKMTSSSEFVTSGNASSSKHSKKWQWLEEILRREYATRPSRAVNAVCVLFRYMDSIRGFKYLRAATYVRSIELESRHLLRLGNTLIEGADFPIIMALEMAQLCKELSTIFVIDADEFNKLSNSFTGTALNMVNQFETDHQAAFAVTELDFLHHSALYVALKARNIKFIASPRVSRIINTIWSVPHFMNNAQFTSSGRGISSLGFILLFQPKNFTTLPCGKFIIQAFGFIVFLLSYSVNCLEVVKSGSPLSGWEAFIWLQALAFILEEVREMYRIGAIKYIQDDSNRVDSLISLGMIIVFSIRTVPNAPSSLTTVYSFWKVVNAILLWIRVGFIFQIHPALGPLLRTTFVIMGDVVNFIILTMLFMMGFSFSLHFLLHDSIDQFSSFYSTFLEMFQGHLGEFKFSEFSSLAQNQPTLYIYVIILFGIYLALSSVVLLNLLIAMLSQTYSTVQQVSIEEYEFGKAWLTWLLDINNNEMPAPFNLIVMSLSIVYSILALISRALYCLLPPSWRNQLSLSIAKTEVEQIAADLLDDAGNVAAPVHHRSGISTSKANLTWPWRCKHCHFVNTHYKPAPNVSILTNKGSVSFRESALHGSVESGIPLTEGEFVSGETVVCSECLRVAQPLHRDAYFREQLSFLVFILVVWVPLIMCVVAPFLVYSILELILSIFNLREEGRKKNVAKKVINLPPVVPRKTRTSYISNLFQDDPVNINDISKELRKLRLGLEEIAELKS